MAALQIRNVPADLHARARERARDERMSVSEYLLELLERDLARPTRREWAERLAKHEPVEVDAAAAVEAGRRERDEELAQARRR